MSHDTTPDVAVAHDYVTQRGGAERVVLSLLRSFPGARLYTLLHDPQGSFPEFEDYEISTSSLNRLGILRRHHRLALPVLPLAASRTRIDAGVVICSSSGWAHGMTTPGRKIVFCHAPARWLYQTERYLGSRQSAGRMALSVLAAPLERWDRKAAASADRYLVVSTVVQRYVREIYGIEAKIVHPPVSLDLESPVRPVEGLEDDFFLCVSRLLPYKNVHVVVDAFRRLPGQRLVVVGDGPMRSALSDSIPPNVSLLGTVDDERLRWLYRSAGALVAASYEDFGLTPIEAALAGKPTVALRAGGYLDTVVEGITGVFFDEPSPQSIASAVLQVGDVSWDAAAILAHAGQFSEERFAEMMHQVVQEEMAAL